MVPESIYNSKEYIGNIKREVSYDYQNGSITLDNHGLIKNTQIKAIVNDKQFELSSCVKRNIGCT